ncbi:membrane protein [Vibrio coralliilyticus]|uniref:Membrane protein n=2 Tax=Vibrio coralliilyticus TaxID=190893 RepID=A0A837G6H4_9VIBR|nr:MULTISPECIES: hypothetical protein [Vibrio]KFI12462.1 membrane protein [Vibrio sp. B183]KJY73142.1 membrane protein [Vibrio coralliilyticus]NOI17068.1 hypothetical protein [Vibrio coralliilyticus]NUW69879.1 hypothetical protein [Vibrio coralliilyticus]QOU31641.1 hypothetical protein TW71_020530 [Vibrio coralliilyticus]
MEKLQSFFHDLFKEIIDVTWTLYKVMIPIIIVIKVVEELGGVALLSEWLSPLMNFVGLPDEMGLVWATTLLTNMYAGLLIFMSTNSELTVAQVSILGSLMLIAHSIPIEAAIAKRAGVSIAMTTLVRVGGGLLFAWVLHQIYQFGDLLNTPAQIVWNPEIPPEQTYLQWAWSQVENLIAILVIIAVLLFTLKMLKLLGVEKLMAMALKPVLSVLGISREATNLTIVGITLGISFGGGLLINEAKRGHIPARDVFTAVMLLNLAHSMIEDTILVLLIGADFVTIFWGRLVFAFVVIAVMSQILKRISEPTCQRYLYKSVQQQ